ncbi:aminotransferase class I/II-fold pyridoxal phosphate-dependent enzyme [Rubellimicrobium rubrum]|uniref:Aminotransferase class I/II-fold pyridoxal phosphate-dependent enzyme n=1 Tax=Rubellimicrobium rubrum TaxID=2585369 RepID=A0A5C4MYM7_9RHOB|nr:aminotransferase class I/II-fold pyridoxal phosphate-dependent enzyme [Rubellimicrobium rubrum]TNC49888.1 aminotransferase class I/II-fold pyridoxal phosphate-dependent enzyme [Rubellimicrobium rubrum]
MTARDHGGGLDAAMVRWGGARADWLDLSTGINPVPYPLPPLPDHAWTALPDRAAADALTAAARSFWNVPEGAEVIPAPGLSAIIARLPHATEAACVHIPGPTYNEYAASFLTAGVPASNAPDAPGVFVHPNNPDGRLWTPGEIGARPLAIIDESFCDVLPKDTHVARAAAPGVVVLKSFGKFWGLAGVRLGFAILAPGPMADRLREALGPWAVSGPALAIGAAALADRTWAKATRDRLNRDAARMDALVTARGARVAAGTTLFRLYEVDDAQAWHDRLARGHVLSRVFPYSATWLRLGLPAPDRWDRIEAAL